MHTGERTDGGGLRLPALTNKVVVSYGGPREVERWVQAIGKKCGSCVPLFAVVYVRSGLLRNDSVECRQLLIWWCDISTCTVAVIPPPSTTAGHHRHHISMPSNRQMMRDPYMHACMHA
jgi:hypothetical protein